VSNHRGELRSISAATDRRRFCQVSKARPRRPQAPPSVRRHPRKAIAILDFRFALKHFHDIRPRKPSSELPRSVSQPFAPQNVIQNNSSSTLFVGRTTSSGLSERDSVSRSAESFAGDAPRALPTPPTFSNGTLLARDRCRPSRSNFKVVGISIVRGILSEVARDFSFLKRQGAECCLINKYVERC